MGMFLRDQSQDPPVQVRPSVCVLPSTQAAAIRSKTLEAECVRFSRSLFSKRSSLQRRV